MSIVRYAQADTGMSEQPIITLRLRMVTLTGEDGLGVVLAIERGGAQVETVTLRMDGAQFLAQIIHDWAVAPHLYEGPTAMWVVDEPVGEPFKGGQPGEVAIALPP